MSHYEGDPDVLCLQLSKRRFVFIMESGNFEREDIGPGPASSDEGEGWWLVPDARS